MDTRTFQSEILKAETMSLLAPDQAQYWHGYRRGLRRAQFGERFGTEHEHTVWMALAESTDPVLTARGRGYREGLACALVHVAWFTQPEGAIGVRNAMPFAAPAGRSWRSAAQA
jgi:hypothetical protein